MDLTQMLSELRSQKAHIEEAILVLQRLAAGGAKRRGRPPKWMASGPEPSVASAPVRKREPFSAATRQKMAAAQRKRWAAARKAG